MEIVNAIAELLPELLKLGGWGALILLFLTRTVLTRGEKEEAISVMQDRIADKDKQITDLNLAVRTGDDTMAKLAAAWQAAIDIIQRQRNEKV